jgi:DNA-binding NtrC family response regulator
MEQQKINLLIVDDEAQFLSAIGRSLELRDFNVLTAGSGDQALALARAHPVDVALVDLKMPGMDGKQTLEALKASHPWMEIIILTGHGTIDSAAACTRSGAHAYLQKPCEFDRLLEVLAEAYKQRVMNKQKITDKKMEDLLKISMGHSPREILARLRSIDHQMEGV